MQSGYASKPMKRALMMAAVLPLTGCAVTTGSETSDAICAELRRDLPTYSTRDTAETLESGADFLDVFAAVCG